MKHGWMIIALVAVMTIAVASESYARGCCCCCAPRFAHGAGYGPGPRWAAQDGREGGRGYGRPDDAPARRLPQYDSATEETITGEVETVEIFTGPRGKYRGVRLVVKTADGSLPVHLGPEQYIDRQEMKIKPGDKIEVRGSRLSMNDKPFLLAAEVRKDNQTLTLRDEKGEPKWPRPNKRAY